MNLISKETTFCSDFEFAMFKEEISKPEVIIELSNQIANDQEDVWFDLYRSITSEKEMAEQIVEKQIQKRQKQKQR